MKVQENNTIDVNMAKTVCVTSKACRKLWYGFLRYMEATSFTKAWKLVLVILNASSKWSCSNLTKAKFSLLTAFLTHQSCKHKCCSTSKAATVHPKQIHKQPHNTPRPHAKSFSDTYKSGIIGISSDSLYFQQLKFQRCNFPNFAWHKQDWSLIAAHSGVYAWLPSSTTWEAFVEFMSSVPLESLRSATWYWRIRDLETWKRVG